MTDIIKGVLEDSRKGILLSDFSGGVVTDTGGLSLQANQSPDALNVYAWEGNLRFRGGYDTWSTLPAAADGAFTYYDINQNLHMVQWAGGNMYDVASGSPVTVATGVYTPGQVIAHEQLNGILYWATLTVPLRQWDGTTEQAVSNAGGTGVVAPPACEFLIAFNGSLVAVNYMSAGVHQGGAFIWSNVNDPHTWVGANTQTVGSNDGGFCVFALLMGVAQVGVSPTKQFMVGKNNGKIFLYEGALGSLIENAVSSPVGIADGASAVYIPTKAGLGGVMFLGDDSQFYLCNGIECPLASEGVKILIGNLVNAALKQNSGQKFNAVYNQRFQYYMCDFGNNTQIIYKWDTGAWWPFSGWPSGVYSTAPTDNGLPSIFVGANYGSATGVYQLALDQTDDNGNTIAAYWTSAYIHGGKPERLKIFEEVTMFSYNVGVQYAVTAWGFPQSNGIVPTTTTLLFNDPMVGAVPPPPTSGSFWGVAKWGIGKWSGPPTSLAQPFLIGGMKGPLKVPAPLTKWGPAGYPTPLRTGGAQFRIAWNAGEPDFKVTSFKIAFIFQNENVGTLPFSGQGQVMNTGSNFGNKFTNTGVSAPLNLPAPAPTPPVRSSCYAISASTLIRQCNVGEYVAFVLGEIDSGNPTGVYAWNNLGEAATVVSGVPGIDGETGMAVDAVRNVLFTQGFGYNAIPPLVPPFDSDLIISTAAPVGTSSLTGPLAPPVTLAYTPHKCPADTQYEWQSLCLSADRTTLYALAGDFSVPTSEMLKIDVLTAGVTTVSAGLGFGDTPTIFLSPDETKVVLVGFPNAINTHKARVVVLNASDFSILNASEFTVDAGGFTGWGFCGAALSPDGTTLVFTTGHSNGTIPGTVFANVFDTNTYSHSQFTVGTDNRFSGVCTFPKNDSANVLIYLNHNLLTFDLTGVAGTAYTLGITNDDGANQIVTEPNSGFIYGTSYGVAPETILWCYDLNTTSLLTEVHGLPAAGGMTNICFARES